MTSLADFTAAALQSSQARQNAELAKLALQQSEAQVQNLIANMPGMVYRYIPCNDASKQFSFVSSGCRDLFEVEAQVALQDAGSIWNLIHPDDLASFTASVGAAIENFLPWDWQGRIITPSGQLKWIHGRSSALQVEGQEVWDGLLIDITKVKRIEAEREQAEIALREAHVQLESALVAGAVYTWRWNISTNCVIVNKAFAHLFGVDPTLASTSGLPIYLYLNAMHSEDRSRVWATIERAIKSGEPYSAEYRVHTANGEERWVSARGQVEYDVDGRIQARLAQEHTNIFLFRFLLVTVQWKEWQEQHVILLSVSSLKSSENKFYNESKMHEKPPKLQI